MILGQGCLMSAEVKEGRKEVRRGDRDEGPQVERQRTQYLASWKEAVE